MAGVGKKKEGGHKKKNKDGDLESKKKRKNIYIPRTERKAVHLEEIE